MKAGAIYRGADGMREVPVRNEAGELVAVVTRPVYRARWFLHRAGRGAPRGEPFRTLKAALAAAGVGSE